MIGSPALPPGEAARSVDGAADAPTGERAAGAQGARRMVSLGDGQRVPYAMPTSPAATKMGKANTRTDTMVEVALRSELHRRGLRFRKDYAVRIPGQRPIRADVAFPRARVLVFVDGCFWHSCPEHWHLPKANRSYWQPKLRANVVRDERVNALCRDAGWTVIRIWEHQPMSPSADLVQAAVAQRAAVVHKRRS
jgi:DNA mismatch endonuclease (patch repair protein)